MNNPDSMIEVFYHLTEQGEQLAEQLSGMAIHLRQYFLDNPVLTDKLSMIERGALSVLGNRIATLILRADSILRDKGYEPIKPGDFNEIPSDVGDAFIRESQFVEDEAAIGLWASLLASYIQETREGGQARKAFTSVLGQLTPFDAQCLKAIYSVDSSRFTSKASLANAFELENASIGEPRGNDIYSGKGISTVLLPDRAFAFDNNLRRSIAEMDQPLSIDLLTSLGNLARLGLIEASAYFDGGSDPRIVFHTGFGLIFSKSIIFRPEA
jgi:hypothetical protein